MTSPTSRLTGFRHDGLSFEVRDEGPLDGDSVVLLHGFPERATAWRRVAPLLHEQGLRTFAPDQRGYSPEARPGRRRDYRLSRLVGDVVALLEEIGRPVHLVGHDWGAAVGWAVAAQHPALLRSWTAVSVPHPVAFTKAMVTSTQGLRSWYMAVFQVPFVPEWLGGTRVFEEWLRASGMDEESLARFRTEMVADGALRGGLMWYRALPLPDQAVSVGRIRVPTTFVWSDKDAAIGPVGARNTEALVAAPYEYVELNGVSHWIPTEAPEQLTAAILRRIESAG
jgi:pimeloyl-ACP methyl ester carboxylesterase